MPTSLLSTDTMFPNFKGNETTEEKVDQIQNYLYMLVEQLRYSMANIGAENFNETEFDNIVNLITEPVYLQLSDELGENNAYIQATAEDLTARIDGVNKALSEAQGETNRAVAELQLSVNGFNTTVTEVSGKYTELRQTVNSIKLSAAEDANGNTTSITLSGTGIETTSANIKFKGEVTFEALQSQGYVTTNTIEGALADKGYVTSNNIDSIMTGKGYVTTDSLGNDANITVINGAHIMTGIIDACRYNARGVGQSFVVQAYEYPSFVRDIGGIMYYQDEDGAYADKMYLYTNAQSGMYPSIKIKSAGRISLEAEKGKVFIKSSSIEDNAVDIQGYEVKITDLQTGAVWEFKAGGLYKNEVQVL